MMKKMNEMEKDILIQIYKEIRKKHQEGTLTRDISWEVGRAVTKYYLSYFWGMFVLLVILPSLYVHAKKDHDEKIMEPIRTEITEQIKEEDLKKNAFELKKDIQNEKPTEF